jgi:hypothetical protein
MMPRRGSDRIVGVVDVRGVVSGAFGTSVGAAALFGDALGSATRPVRRVALPVQRRVFDPVVRSVTERAGRELHDVLARADRAVDVLVPAVVANLMGRVDLAQLIEDNVDLDRLAMDVVNAVDLPRIIRESSGTVTSEAVRGVRTQSMEADQAIARVVDRVLHRGRSGTPAVPLGAIVDPTP